HAIGRVSRSRSIIGRAAKQLGIWSRWWYSNDDKFAQEEVIFRAGDCRLDFVVCDDCSHGSDGSVDSIERREIQVVARQQPGAKLEPAGPGATQTHRRRR